MDIKKKKKKKNDVDEVNNEMILTLTPRIHTQAQDSVNDLNLLPYNQ